MDAAKNMLSLEYEIELEINRQLYKENHITYEIYEKVNTLILKDISRLSAVSYTRV